MGKTKGADVPNTRAERTERLTERELIPLNRREERAIIAAEQTLESLTEGLEDLEV